MYIIYYIYENGDYDIFPHDCPAIATLGPSECQWIVPGTINPNED